MYRKLQPQSYSSIGLRGKDNGNLQNGLSCNGVHYSPTHSEHHKGTLAASFIIFILCYHKTFTHKSVTWWKVSPSSRWAWSLRVDFSHYQISSTVFTVSQNKQKENVLHQKAINTVEILRLLSAVIWCNLSHTGSNKRSEIIVVHLGLPRVAWRHSKSDPALRLVRSKLHAPGQTYLLFKGTCADCMLRELLHFEGW